MTELNDISEKAMAPHSSTLAWKIPWTEEPGRLQSLVSLSQGQLRDFIFTFHFHALEKERRKEKRTKEGKEKPANPYLNITEE